MGERRGMALVDIRPLLPVDGVGEALVHIEVESNGEFAPRLASGGTGDRRAGSGSRLAWGLEREGLELRATVRARPHGAGIVLALADLPERQRSAIAAAIRGGELRRLLTVEEHARLEQGEELLPLVRQALTRRVQGLAEDRSPAALAAVTELLVLLDQLGQAVPFDAQTAFYRVWQAHGADEGAMARLAHRMGFVAG